MRLNWAVVEWREEWQCVQVRDIYIVKLESSHELSPIIR